MEEDYLYIPEGCCQGQGRTDENECCGGKQCEEDCECE